MNPTLQTESGALRRSHVSTRRPNTPAHAPLNAPLERGHDFLLWKRSGFLRMLPACKPSGGNHNGKHAAGHGYQSSIGVLHESPLSGGGGIKRLESFPRPRSKCER
ncbi:hypothetical protein EYF80_040124 [Liparis tanakae]|uniref:Uncharacterized protein n=1 Tax=Liparis tanakae TaxID=230148 RepID=A0A4Z2GA52_9TELE|nr:hypothetical protein EYF80_040124 [Liparis tanakae]